MSEENPFCTPCFGTPAASAKQDFRRESKPSVDALKFEDTKISVDDKVLEISSLKSQVMSVLNYIHN